jgi:hypothetical protein
VGRLLMREPPPATCHRPLSANGHSHDLAPAAFDRALEMGDPFQASELPNALELSGARVFGGHPFQRMVRPLRAY